MMSWVYNGHEIPSMHCVFFRSNIVHNTINFSRNVRKRTFVLVRHVRRFRSACAFAKSYQILYWVHLG